MRVALPVVAGLLVCAACFAGVASAAHEEPDRTILGVELDAEGDAVVYYVQSYDLNETEERERYEAVATNESRQADRRESVMAELAEAAADGRNRTELAMAVGNGSLRTYEQEGYGRVAVRAEWENLAFYNDRRVVVTEPFRGGYAPAVNRLAIHGPEGYRRARMAPSPLRARANSALWDPRTSNFSRFYAEFEDPDAGATTDGDGRGDGDGDGAGTGAGDSGLGTFLQALVLALLPVALVLFAVRRDGNN